MVPMRIVPVLVLEEKAEYDDEDEESFLSRREEPMKSSGIHLDRA
jgi:hypothetical protein